MEPLGEEVEDENDDNDKIENNAMIKATKKQAEAGTSSRGKAREETGKGKGKGRGKNRK